MTLSTSAVAVCCSNASVSSVVRSTQFVQQPRVLDGDNRLSSEVVDQRDLLVIEWTHFLPEYDECADQIVVLQHGHTQTRPYSPRVQRFDDSRIAFCVTGSCRHVVYMKYPDLVIDQAS